ncbi:MAG TPA: CHAP domain-containing protein [Patescibacteria group bacterium]|nr:CHAP domain-containing protein [Patescibacteria group bacterium]
MKLFMQKQKLRTRIVLRVSQFGAVLIALVVLSASVTLPIVHADQFDDQINALRQQNSQSQSALNGLQAQASSYQDAVNKLQDQINALQSAINANLAKQADLQQQIVAAQAELDKEKATLGEDIRAMYVGGQISTLEMLASSKDLSDFVDKQEYRSAVQDKIKTELDKVTKLKLQLQDQKEQVDDLLKDQKNQQDQLATAQSQQNQLLAYNQSQQADYNNQISSNQGKIADLRRQQIILNGQYNIGDFKGDPNNGGYPSAWANAPQDSMIDNWGMYNRECVSYTAFKVHQDFLAGKDNRDMPYWGGMGNANQWDDDARAYGIPVDDNPTPGSIAISNAGAYGHAMYVEAVNGNQIYVQQYNQQLNGQYSEGWRYTTGLVFIHF